MPTLSGLKRQLSYIRWPSAGEMWRMIVPNTLRHRPSTIKKIAFVIPWYGEDIGGGAESACRSLVHGLHSLAPDVTVEVISTTLRQFSEDWNRPVHPEGSRLENGVMVHRFNPTTPDRTEYHHLNGSWLMTHEVASLKGPDGEPHSPITRRQEQFYLHNMINSPSLYRFLDSHYGDYDRFVYLPYMFALTVHGVAITRGKSVVIPCLHNERYAYMRIFKRMMAQARAVLFLAEPERQLARDLYKLPESKSHFLGLMVDGADDAAFVAGDGERFKKAHGIDGPYMLYAGRKVTGKNLPEIVEYVVAGKKSGFLPPNFNLVVIGGGELDYSSRRAEGIIDLGFVSAQDKKDAFAGASIFCMPSWFESFSIVIMEAWLSGVPCLVAQQCDVTRDHVQRSRGGFAFSGQSDFIQHTKALLSDVTAAKAMGLRGKNYVQNNFTQKSVVDRLLRTLTDT